MDTRGTLFFPNGDEGEKALDIDADELVQKKDPQIESDETAQRILARAIGIEDMGAGILVELDRQDEKLKTMDKSVDYIDEDLRAGRDHLRVIRSWWASLFGGSSYKDKEVRADAASEQTATNVESDQLAVAATVSEVEKSDPVKVSNSAAGRRRQTDAVLDQVHTRMKNIGAITTEIGTTVKKQNPQIDKLDRKVQESEAEMRDQTRLIVRTRNGY